ncbi:calretinin-like isoform X1 [Amphiura filiformis]|uniref:calretinin-like isoform X1 n=1 Tax=Amphiura filiformis TaxID=82378 RepID=UPI003B222E1E
MSHLNKCTAEYFTATWRKYDADGNGYIEDKELKSFLTDLAKDESTQTDIEKFTKTFMQKYDKNKDGKIDMRELAEVLKPEENFLFLIRTGGGPSSVEFKKIWSKYDADASGYIEACELKNFLRDAYASCGKSLSAEKLDEYTAAALKLYDRDDNHKLDFNEMIKLLPLATNHLKDRQVNRIGNFSYPTKYCISGIQGKLFFRVSCS